VKDGIIRHEQYSGFLHAADVAQQIFALDGVFSHRCVSLFVDWPFLAAQSLIVARKFLGGTGSAGNAAAQF
jgi:hypothetical protein